MQTENFKQELDRSYELIERYRKGWGMPIRLQITIPQAYTDNCRVEYILGSDLHLFISTGPYKNILGILKELNDELEDALDGNSEYDGDERLPRKQIIKEKDNAV